MYDPAQPHIYQSPDNSPVAEFLLGVRDAAPDDPAAYLLLVRR